MAQDERQERAHVAGWVVAAMIAVVAVCAVAFMVYNRPEPAVIHAQIASPALTSAQAAPARTASPRQESAAPATTASALASVAPQADHAGQAARDTAAQEPAAHAQ